MNQFTLSWKNINVEVTQKKKSFWKTTIAKKTIVDNVSGTASNNSLTAVIGISGCGKTTLLNAISGRCRNKTGFIFIDNVNITDNILRNISGYVHQQDIFTEYMTVTEHLQFTAAFQLNDKTEGKRCIIVKKLLSDFSLEYQSNTLIKDLSGGERRRLSLAKELISSPFILFCDEPTTGLDSHSAAIIVEKLQAIAYSGKIVLTTIHQPSSRLFQYFNNIMLLADGKIVFQGTKQEATVFFESMNLICPPSYNPADFYIKCLAEKNTRQMCRIFENQKKLVKVEYWRNNYFDNSIMSKNVENNLFHEMKWLLWRSYIENKRNASVRLGCYVCVLFEVVAIGLCYKNLYVKDENSVQNIQGFLAFLTSEFVFTNLYAVINVFPGEAAVYVREKRLYSSFGYFISKIFSMMPLSLISTFIYMTILFLFVKFLNGLYLWIEMSYIAFLVGTASCGLGLAFSANFSTVEQVNLFLGPLEFILLLQGGLFIKLDTLPIPLIWIKFLSPFYYSYDSFSHMIWQNITNSSNCLRDETTMCYKRGSEVLQTYGIYKAYDIIPYNIFYLHILTIVFCLIGFIGILRKKVFVSV